MVGGRVKIPRFEAILLLITISILSLFLSGCSVMRPVGDFFGQRYINTVSYFNTFYNAKNLFEEAVAETEEAELRHRRQQSSGQFEVPQNTKQKFNDVIEKCSRLLHQYPTSRYADEAVLKIGKSYYLMRQNIQAERKFLELISEFPDSRLVPEGQLLLAKTQLRMNKQSEAEVALENLVGRLDSRRDRDIAARAYIELGNIEKRAGNLNNAISHFEQGVEIARDSEIRTEARFHLANILYELELYDDAFDKYAEVVSDRPTNKIIYDSEIARTRILTHSGEYEKALEMLANMLNVRELADYHAGIELEAAHIYKQEGYIDDAIHQYVYVDTTHARTTESLQARYQLGDIYLNTLNDYETAKQYYETVSRSTPPSNLTRSAWAVHDFLERYTRHKNEITRLDSMLAQAEVRLRELEAELVAQADTAVAADTATVAESDTTELAAELEEAPGEQQGEPEIVETPEQLREQITTNRKELVRNYYELAGLFYMEMERPDSAIYYYSRLAYDYPESEYAPQALYALAELVRSTSSNERYIVSSNHLLDSDFMTKEPSAQRDSIYQLLIDQYPDTEFADEARRILGMEVQRKDDDALEDVYLQAEKLFTDAAYDDALYMFQYISDDTTGSKFAAQARYAIGWMYENIYNKPDSAAFYYQKLVDTFPESQYASVVKDKVNVWNEMIAEEQRRIEEEEAARLAEEAEAVDATDDDVIEEVEEEEMRQRGIPITRPTDRENFEEISDTTRTIENNED